MSEARELQSLWNRWGVESRKSVESQRFPNFNTLSLINGRPTQIASASAPEQQLLVSNLEKPFILTMIGSTIADPMVTQNSLPSGITQIQTNPLNTSMGSDRSIFRRDSGSETTLLSVFSEDSISSQMSSPRLTIDTSHSSLQNGSPLTFNLSNGLIFDNTSQKMDITETSIDGKTFKTEIPLVVSESTTNSTTIVPMVEPLSQYLPLNSFDTMSSNAVVMDSSPQISTIESIPAINSMSCEPILQPMSSTTSSTQSLPLVDAMTTISSPVESKPIISQESDAMKLIVAQNPVLTSTASTTPVTTQANNISTLSEMTDAELLRFINPDTFDQI